MNKVDIDLLRLKNRIMICTECGELFNFTASEQCFYLAKQFEDPRRCSACRRKRKSYISLREDDSYLMRLGINLGRLQRQKSH